MQLLVRAPHYEQFILSSSCLQLPVVSRAAGARHIYYLRRDRHLVVIADHCKLPLHCNHTSAAACLPTAHLTTPSPARLLQTVLPVLGQHATTLLAFPARAICNRPPRTPSPGSGSARYAPAGMALPASFKQTQAPPTTANRSHTASPHSDGALIG